MGSAMFLKKLLFAIALLFISAVVFVQSREFIYPVSVYINALNGILALLGCLHLVTCFTKDRREKTGAPNMTPRLRKRVILGLGLALAYGGMLPYVGFYATSFIYFVSAVYFFNPKRTPKSLMIAMAAGAAGSVLLYGLFHMLLHIPTPRGFLI